MAVQIINEVFIPTLWQSEYTKEHGIGASDPEKWQALIDDSAKYGIIEEGFKAEEILYTPGE